MSLLPVDTDALADICRSISMSNYGFLYVADRKEEIRNRYESANTGVLSARSLSTSALKQTLRDLSSDEFTDFEQLREGVYYVDTFGVGSSTGVTDELTNVFSQRVVITAEMLRSRFGLAIDDTEFYASELERRDLVRRITAGERDYFTIGPRLKEHAGNVGLDAQLERKTANGKITHGDLEKVIDVSATTDVIRYLEREGYIVDLDGEYLVEGSLDEYGAYVANEIEMNIAETFEESQYLLPRPEFPQVIRSEIQDRFDVLSRAHGIQEEIVEATQDAVTARLGLEVDREMVVQASEYETYVDAEARRILGDVKAESDILPASPSEFADAADEHVEELRISGNDTVNRYVRSSVRDHYDEIVGEEEFGGHGV